MKHLSNRFNYMKNKKTLLLINENDYTSVQIIKWFNYLNIEYVVINENNKVVNLHLNLTENSYSFEFNHISNLSYKEIKNVWFRNGSFFFHEKSERNSTALSLHYKNELDILNSYLITELKNSKFFIGDFLKENINKLYVLKCASKFKFNVPFSIIVNNKSVLKFDSTSSLISKTIGEIINTYDYSLKRIVKMRTSILDINKMPEVFFPSLIQNNLDKKYEIRVFIFNKIVYSMAIFSQNNSATKIDFRNYENNHNVRYVPYVLEKEIEVKILKLMTYLKLTTGSIDLIKTTSNEIYFLEINPIGQFGFLSHYCNYNIEKNIANCLNEKE